MVDESEKPEKVTEKDLDEQRGSRTGRLQAIAVPLIIAVIVAIGVFYFMVAPKFVAVGTDMQGVMKNLDAIRVVDQNQQTGIDQIGNLNSQLKQATSDLQAIKTDVATFNGKLSSYALQSSVNNLSNLPDKVASLSSDVTKLKDSLDSLGNTYVTKTALVSFSSDLAALQKSMAEVKASIDSVKPYNDAALKTSIQTIQQALSPLQASIDKVTKQAGDLSKKTDDIATRLTKLETGSAPTPGVTGQVKASIIGNTWTGSQVMNFNAMTASATQGQPLSFSVTNNTTKTITNVQLAIGFELLDTSNNILTNGLVGVTFSLTASGLSTIWGQQSTGFPYIIGFTNTTATGIFGDIGALSQAPGTTNYTVTFGVTNMGTTSLAAFNAYPIIKVVSFN